MQTNEKEVSLDNLMQGAVIESFDDELQKVWDNGLDEKKMMADFDRWFIPIITTVVLIAAAVITGHVLCWLISGG